MFLCPGTPITDAIMVTHRAENVFRSTSQHVGSHLS
jgi:hypothetical protein